MSLPRQILSFPQTANGWGFSVRVVDGLRESARPWRHTGADRHDIRSARWRNLASGWHDRVRHQRGPVSGVRERGEPRLLVKPDPGRKERAYSWPQFMPDGRSVLFTIVPEDSIEGAQIAVLDLNTLEARVVLKGGSAARYASTGHLVYASGQTLKAIAFDPDTQQTRGDPVSLPDIEIATTPDNGAAEFAVSETGTLLFITPNVPGQGLRTLSWVDRQGKEEPLALAPGRYEYARISPDGTRVALDIPGANRDIWIWNLQRPGLTKLTNGPTEDMLPVWSRGRPPRVLRVGPDRELRRVLASRLTGRPRNEWSLPDRAPSFPSPSRPMALG